MREMAIDNFAGGGGASLGFELATGHSVDVAINHDPAAIAMHQANHPATRHYLEDVWDVDPRDVCQGRPVALNWLSPSCTHHSNAAGGKPKNKQLRGQAWLAVRWAATVRPKVQILENVREFQTWGPLLENGQPDPKRKGLTYNTFVNAMKKQGYKVETRLLRAQDYGAPTSRERLFMIMRSDGKPIVWPKPTHGDPSSEEVRKGILLPWKTAADCIDWTLECPSIFRRSNPLAEKTMKRIFKGIHRFVLTNDTPFIVPDSAAVSNLDNKKHLVAGFLSKYYSEISENDARGQHLDAPLHTISTANRFALVTCHLVKFRGTNFGSAMDQPLPTISAGGTHFGEIRCLLQKYTQNDSDSLGLVRIHGELYLIVDIGFRMLQAYELYKAQGFPESYVIDGYNVDGKPVTKKDQVARCGNSVPPPFARALIRANLPELCIGSGNTLALERYADQYGQLELTM